MIKIGLLTLTVLFWTSISQADSHRPEFVFPHKYQFKESTLRKHLGPEEHIRRIDRNRNFTDMDSDGIADLVDPDIDGDGVLNFMDLAPLDQKKKGTDSDGDGLPDFIDFKTNGKLIEGMNQRSARLQLYLWKTKKILIFNGDLPFTNKEFQRIALLFIEKELAALADLESLRFIFKQPRHSMGYRAKYLAGQKAIFLFENIDHKNSSLFQELSLVHEVFHAIALEFPDVYEDFQKAVGWSEDQNNFFYQSIPIKKSDLRVKTETVIEVLSGSNFPNDYSKLGPEEMFAECATASLLKNRGPKIQVKYPYFNDYLGSEAAQFFEVNLPSILK